MNTEVHVLHRMDNDVNELHASYLETQQQFNVSQIAENPFTLLKCQVESPQPTMKSMLQSSLIKYSINFSKRFFSLLTFHKKKYIFFK